MLDNSDITLISYKGKEQKKRTMLKASYINRAMKEVENAELVTASIAPGTIFRFEAMDEKYIYFNVVAKNIPSVITDDQKRDLLEKTRFSIYSSDSSRLIYCVTFKVLVAQ